jgi:hypothetical protein
LALSAPTVADRKLFYARLGLLLIYLPSELLYGLFVFGWCKSPNLIWLPGSPHCAQMPPLLPLPPHKPEFLWPYFFCNKDGDSDAWGGSRARV